MLYELILINEIEQRAKIIFLSVYILLCCVTYNCTVLWEDLTYISLLIIFCIIEYVTDKTLNPWICIICLALLYPSKLTRQIQYIYMYKFSKTSDVILKVFF